MSPYYFPHHDCRFCDGSGERGHLIKYGVRHWAHTKCLIDRKGEEFVLSLPSGALTTASVLFFSRKGQRRLLAMFR